MDRHLVCVILGASVVVGLASSAAAQEPRHGVSLNIGYFAVRAEDARIEGDVLNANLSQLAFNVSDFNNATVGGEWFIGIGNYLEAAAGLGFHRRTVPSTYAHLVNEDRSEIRQQLKLRAVPLTLAVRFFPLSRVTRIQPYVGAGIGIFAWRYSETGEFVDFFDSSIYRERYVAEGRDVGRVVMGGVRLAATDRISVGGEVRYQHAHGALDPALFLGDRIDLGGYSYGGTLQIGF